MNNKCKGCLVEMEECYKWQSKGYDAGLDWGSIYSVQHCSVFVLDMKGETIIE